MFQPSPGAMTGCDSSNGFSSGGASSRFQPSPGAMTGCDMRATMPATPGPSFQPSPGAMTGCDTRAGLHPFWSG